MIIPHPSIDFVADNLVYYRKKRGLSRRELCNLSGCDYAWLSKIEARKKRGNMTIETALRVSEAMDIYIDQLLEDPLDRAVNLSRRYEEHPPPLPV